MIKGSKKNHIDKSSLDVIKGQSDNNNQEQLADICLCDNILDQTALADNNTTDNIAQEQLADICNNNQSSFTDAKSINNSKESNNQKRRTSIKYLTLIAMFITLIIASAFIRIPIPFIPITFQVTMTTLAALVLGAKYGTLCVAIYIAMGLAGLPIFANGSGGIGYVMQPSFGYLIGFLVGAFVTGILVNKLKFKKQYLNHFIAGFVGVVIVYIVGCIYLYFMTRYGLGMSITVGKVLVSYFLMLFPKDVALVALACIISQRTSPIIQRMKDKK